MLVLLGILRGYCILVGLVVGLFVYAKLYIWAWSRLSAWLDAPRRPSFRFKLGKRLLSVFGQHTVNPDPNKVLHSAPALHG